MAFPDEQALGLHQPERPTENAVCPSKAYNYCLGLLRLFLRCLMCIQSKNHLKAMFRKKTKLDSSTNSQATQLRSGAGPPLNPNPPLDRSLLLDLDPLVGSHSCTWGMLCECRIRFSPAWSCTLSESWLWR